MRTQLLAATALTSTIAFLVPGAAFAAGPLDWSGFYAGLSAGVVTSQASVDFTGLGSTTIPSHVNLPELGKDGSVKLGYNWQNGQFVYGLEQDLSVLSLSGTHSHQDSADIPDSYSVDDSLSTLLSLRARFGVTFDRMMIFATAGVAGGESSFNTDVGKNQMPASASGLVTGGVIGGGLEYAVNDNVRLTATGTYYGLSSLHAVGDAGKSAPPPDGTSIPYGATYSPHGAVFEAGVNVHF
jgi:outer membrane immunogenic protein